MQTRTMTISVIAAFAASPGLWVCAPTTGQTIIPIDQGRYVSTENVNAPQCSGDFLFDGDAAKGFEPFDSVVATNHGCDSGTAFATASQQSQIGATSMTGLGSAYSEAHGPVPGFVHAFGISYFEVTFELPSASRFTLDGTISVVSLPDENVGAGVLVRLWEGLPGGFPILQRSVQPLPGGKTNSQLLEEAGVLEPGLYTLDVQGGTFMKNPVPPSRYAQASFDFTFGVSILGDVDGDGIVGILDFLLVLGNWGPCPEPCPPSCAADLDDDCQVGIFEFLLVLGNWS